MRRLLIPMIVGLCCARLASQVFDTALWLNAARDILHGVNPYHIDNLINPIIVPLAFVPVAWMTDDAVMRLLSFVSGSIAVTLIWREHRHPIIAALLLLSPVMYYSVRFPNLDWIVSLSLFVSPVPAFFLALIKPQVGAGVALIALLAVWKRNRPLAALMVLIAVIVYGASYLLGMRWGWAIVNYNFSVFPYGLIVGVPLLLFALRRRDPVMAFAAMPFISPYVGDRSWIAVLPLLARFPFIKATVHAARYTVLPTPKPDESQPLLIPE